MQPLMRWACEKLEGFWRIIVADVFLFVSFVGTVNGNFKLTNCQFINSLNFSLTVWRGIWALLDCYFLPGKNQLTFSRYRMNQSLLNLPDNKLLSDWLTHGVSLILLILLNCSNSVLVRGVYIDAEEPAGQCVIFPVYYIRLFFQKERTKKQKRLMEKLDKCDKNNTVLLIEKHQINHTPDESKVQQTSLIVSNEDIISNQFNESDDNNEIIHENDEHKILCGGE